MISLVIPVYTEESLVNLLFEHTIAFLSAEAEDFEVILAYN
jgi:hypothetical protein